MVELAALAPGGPYQRNFAGDTYNTAVYLARAGLEVAYLTRLGDDALSAAIIGQLTAEGIATDLVSRAPGRQPGLYLVDNDTEGERHFSYWRGEAPARQLFDAIPDMAAPAVFYFSGITVAVARSGHANLLALLARLRDAGCRIVFDSNYRPALWRDIGEARELTRAVLCHCDIALPTLADDTALWGTGNAADCRDAYLAQGAREVVVKGADLTAHASCGTEYAERRADPVTAIDTTGAGDAFNAGYLAARLAGASLYDALARGQQLAAQVVQHRGAILPRH